jgi:nucleoid DNA-binding protein
MDKNNKEITPEELLASVLQENPDSKFNIKSAEKINEVYRKIRESKKAINNLTEEELAKVEEIKRLAKVARKRWKDFVGQNVTHKVLTEELKEKVKKEAGETLTRADASYLVSSLIGIIEKALKEGKTVYLKNVGNIKPAFSGGKPYHDSVKGEMVISDLTIRNKLNPSRNLKPEQRELINKFKEWEKLN